MKTVDGDRNVQTSGAQDETEFKIKASGKAFKVLIDGLYSDKPRAIVRELWTNAYDAHIAAGCQDKPFECKLPTSLDPVFHVRDYGIGMNDGEIMGLYSTVFDSSKDDSNDFVGCLGLGSKSPFSYTDSFTVTAYDGVVKRIYNAFLGPKGVPKIALFHSELCGDARGIEVSFPVKSHDCKDFLRAAERVSLGFKVKPVVKPADSYKPMEDPKTLHSGDGWKIVERLNKHDKRASMARQGCVLYPIDPNAIPNLSKGHRVLLDSNVIIDFSIGELEIAASREALGYTEATVANIKKRLDVVEESFLANVRRDVAAAKTYFDACGVFKKYAGDRDNPVRAGDKFNSIKWNGREVGSSIDIKDEDIKGIPFTLLGSYDIRNLFRFSFRAHYRNLQVIPDPNFLFIIDDMTVRGAPTRLTRYVNEMDDDKRPKIILWVKEKDNNKARIKRLIRLLGYPTNILRTSTLPEPPKKSKKNQAPDKLKEWKRHDRRWTENRVEVSKGGYYVVIRNNQIKKPDGSEFPSYYTFANLISYLERLDILSWTDTVCAVPETKLDMMKGHEKKWTNVFDLAEKTLKKYYKTADVKAYAIYSGVSNSDTGNLIAKIMKSQDLEIKDKAGPAFKFGIEVDKVDSAGSSASSKSNNLRSLARCMGFPDVDVTAEIKAYNDLAKQIDLRYPMLKHATCYSYRQEAQILEDCASYINMIDKTRKGVN